jgi:hypothetical protein
VRKVQEGVALRCARLFCLQAQVATLQRADMACRPYRGAQVKIYFLFKFF